MKDVESAGTLLSTSFVLVVDPKMPVHSVTELTRYLKEKKGETFYGGSTNTGIVASELYKKAIGVDSKRVNYRSAFDALNEMSNGSIDFYFTDATTAIGQVAGGKYRPLAVTATKRTAAFPDVPTMTEAGVPMDFAPWWAVLVPAGTPRPIKEKLAAWFRGISDMPDTKEFLIRSGLDPLPGDDALMRKLLVQDTQRWGEWAKLANIEPQ
jgi:tripartite-type tricarboxylate transporter receptor subunit TctC